MDSITLSNGLVIQDDDIIKIEYEGNYLIIYVENAKIIERTEYAENTEN